MSLSRLKPLLSVCFFTALAALAARGAHGDAASRAPGASGTGGNASQQPALAPDDVGSEGTGGSGAAPTLKLIEGPRTCDRCDPAGLVLELLFSAEVDPARLLEHVKAVPPLVLSATPGTPARSIELSGTFQPETRYSLMVDSDLCAETDGCLAEPLSFELRTGGGSPSARMPTRDTVLPPGTKLPLEFARVERAALTLIPLAGSEAPEVLPLAGVHPTSEEILPKVTARLRSRARRIDIDCARDAPDGKMEIDPFTSGFPLAFVVLEAPGAPRRAAVVQRGELGTILKTGSGGGVLWTTRTRSGEPAAGLDVSVFRGKRRVHRGRTDSQGLLALPAKSLLGATTEAPLYAVVADGEHTSVTTDRWTSGLEPWVFDVPSYYWSGPRALRGMISSERGIYRAGETVHLLSVLREKRADGTLGVPSGDVEIVVRDPEGSQIARRRPALSAYGTARAELTLDRNAAPGQYDVTLARGEARLYASFEVGSFRAASFEVKLPEAGPARRDEAGAVLVPVRASYLFGAPVKGGRVKWSVSRRPRTTSFEGYEAFSFSALEDGYYYTEHLTSGEAVLDAEGGAELRVEASSLGGTEADAAQAIDLVFEVTVVDAADHEITARSVQSLFRADVLVGLNSSEWIVGPKRGWDVELVVLDTRGKPVPGRTLELELTRAFWNTVAEEGAGGVRYRSSRETVVVSEQTLTSKAAKLTHHLALPGGGEYTLVLREKGQPFRVSRSVWAYGPEATWQAENSPRMELKLDRDSYRAGETARAFASVPYARSTALVTVERDGVLAARVERLQGMDRPLEVKVDERYLPNAYVSVVAVPRPAGEPLPAAGVPFRMGYRELRVEAGQRRLTVDLEPTRDALEPGQEATVEVKVRDARGAPVSAELTLWAADEGVLMLTGYKTPDPFAPAYAPFELGVETATNLVRWTQFDSDAWEDGGGDAGIESSALRSRFLHTAFFSGPVVTDARGRARVRFRLPDNLTRWRVMAVAADRGQRFGKGETSIRVSKPLMLSPALPARLTAGDLVDAGFLVQNQTGARASATVALEVRGAKLIAPSSQTLELAAGEQRAVRFPLHATKSGAALLAARVEAGRFRDGLKLEIPVRHPTRTEQRFIQEGTIERNTTLEVELPRAARPDSLALKLSAATSELASLGPSLGALLDYPHGCAEQKTSRLIPMIALGDLARSLSYGDLDQREHRRRLEDTLVELREHQNDDGGFGLWPDSESEPFVTAYVLFGWLFARQHGYPVPAARLSRGIGYLKSAIRDETLEQGYFHENPRVFAALALALAGEDDLGLSTKLYAARASLGHFEQGLLATAFAPRDRAKAAEIVNGLLKARESEGPGRARVAEKSRDDSGYFLGYGADLRATAATVRALAALGRGDEAEALVASMLAARDPKGTWGTTYNNQWALYALGAHLDARRSSSDAASVRVELEGKSIAELALSHSTPVASITLPASALPAAGQTAHLVLSARSGRPRYAVTLEVAELSRHQAPESEGYAVSRQLLDAETGQPVTRPHVGQLLRVRLAVDASESRSQTAVVDPLPAGFEAVNARLVTETGRGQAESGWEWSASAIHEDRVAFFAYGLDKGSHRIEYLVRALRSGEFVWPAAYAESMYQPGERGRSSIEKVIITRP